MFRMMLSGHWSLVALEINAGLPRGFLTQGERVGAAPKVFIKLTAGEVKVHPWEFKMWLRDVYQEREYWDTQAAWAKQNPRKDGRPRPNMPVLLAACEVCHELRVHMQLHWAWYCGEDVKPERPAAGELAAALRVLDHTDPDTIEALYCALSVAGLHSPLLSLDMVAELNRQERHLR